MTKTKPRITRATRAEAEWWRLADELYPLYGWLICEDGQRRPIESLPANGDDPRYEVHAPAGWVYADTCHTHLCFTLDDVRDYGAETIEREAA